MDSNPGEKLRAARRRRGMTIEAAAALCGRSVGWLKKIESGERGLPRVAELIRLCEIVGINDLAEVTGDTTTPTLTALGRPVHDALPAIRSALTSYRLESFGGGHLDYSVPALRIATDRAWKLWHSSPNQRTEVGRLLPGLLASTRWPTASGDTPGLAVVADIYHLAQQMLAGWAEPELVWITADRGMAAATAADDRLTLAGAAWCAGNMLRAVGRGDEAIELALDAAGSLAEADDPEAKAMRGALFAHAATSAARDYAYGDAWRYWDRAAEEADGLGDYVHPWTVFGAANLGIHAVSIEVDSGRHRQALDRFSALDLSASPSRERLVRALIEGARAHAATGSDLAALHLLQRAETVSGESVKFTAPVRALVAGMLSRVGSSSRDEVQALAQRVGVAE